MNTTTHSLIRNFVALLVTALSLAFTGFLGHYIAQNIGPINAAAITMIIVMLAAAVCLFLLDLIALEWAFDKPILPVFLGRIADKLASF